MKKIIYGPGFLALLLIMVVMGRPGLSAGKGDGATIMLILDASGSMQGQIDGKAKIVIARDSLGEIVYGLPDNSKVGLIAYGHRKKGDCNDVELVSAVAPIDKSMLVKKIQKLNPKGKTPITLSIKLAIDALKASEGEATIILVSDGKETCAGDPCGLVRQLKESGVEFEMHVIGFDVSPDERMQLECIAKSGGGRYYSAGNAADFKVAVQKVTAAPAKSPGLTAIAYPYRSGDGAPPLAVDGDLKTHTWTTPPYNPVEPAFLGVQFARARIKTIRLYKSNHPGCKINECDGGVKNLVVQYTNHADPSSIISEPLGGANWANVGNLTNGNGSGKELMVTKKYAGTPGGVFSDGRVDNEYHNSADLTYSWSVSGSDGWFSLSFDPVTATGVRIAFSQDHKTTPNYNHYAVWEFEVG